MSAQRMHNADAAWLHMDRPTNLMVVNSVLWFDEPVDIERAKEVLRVRFVERFPRFRQRIAEPRLGDRGAALGGRPRTSTSTITSTTSRSRRPATRRRSRRSSAT